MKCRLREFRPVFLAEDRPFCVNQVLISLSAELSRYWLIAVSVIHIP